MNNKTSAKKDNQIPNAFIRWHFSALSHSPLLAQQLKRALCVPDEVFEREGRLLSANQYAELLSQTIKTLDDESFGALERPLRRGSFHMMCYACISCATLGQVIERCIRFFRLCNEQLHWHLDAAGDSARLSIELDGADSETASYFMAFLSCTLWRWLSWVIDDNLPLNGVTFPFSEPECAKQLRPVFNAGLGFDADATSLYFPASFLDKPVKQTARTLERFLIKVPECLLSHYKADMRLSKRVSDYLQAHEELNQVTLSMAAEYFCCSEQTLIRGLRSEKTRFKTVKDEIQKRRAHKLMVTTSLSNQEISRRLGFSEPSVFYRAVKKWFAQTPNQYRDNPPKRFE